jgi:hypothetical protein
MERGLDGGEADGVGDGRAIVRLARPAGCGIDREG